MWPVYMGIAKPYFFFSYGRHDIRNENILPAVSICIYHICTVLRSVKEHPFLLVFWHIDIDIFDVLSWKVHKSSWQVFWTPPSPQKNEEEKNNKLPVWTWTKKCPKPSRQALTPPPKLAMPIEQTTFQKGASLIDNMPAVLMKLRVVSGKSALTFLSALPCGFKTTIWWIV